MQAVPTQPRPEYQFSPVTFSGVESSTLNPSGNSNNLLLTDSGNSLPAEESFLQGMFFDFFKNVPKILTGTLITDILGSTLQDRKQTAQEVVYKSFMDKFFPRISSDTLAAWTIRVFNGNNKIFGFKIPYIMPELCAQLVVNPMAWLWRSATKDFSTQGKAARENVKSEKEQHIKAEIEKRDPPFLQISRKFSRAFKNNIKPVAEKFFGFLIGLKDGKVQKDFEGEVINRKGGDRRFLFDSDGIPKPLKSNYELDATRLTGFIGAAYAASAFLPKHTASFGFEKARSIPRAALTVAITSLGRLFSTMLQQGVAAHPSAGKNFDECFRVSVASKTLVPFVQFCCDALGSYTAKFLPGNGAFLAMTYRMLAEIPATFLSTPVMNVSEEDRIPKEWKYLAFKIWKPMSDFLTMALKPLYKLAFYPIGLILGMYDPRISHMYAGDIRTEEAKLRDNPDPGFMAEFASSDQSTWSLLFKKLLETPGDVYNLITQTNKDAEKFAENLKTTVGKVNAAVERRRKAQGIIERLGLSSNFQLGRDFTREINRRIIYLAEEERISELQELLSLEPSQVGAKEDELLRRRLKPLG